MADAQIQNYLCMNPGLMCRSTVTKVTVYLGRAFVVILDIFN